MLPRFHKELERRFYVKINLIPSNLVINLFLSFFVLLVKTKIRMKFSASCWFGNKKYFWVLFIASRALCQGYSSSVDFYKRIFLHFISVRNIVQWEYPILMRIPNFGVSTVIFNLLDICCRW